MTASGRFDVGVIGGGSGAEAFVAGLDGSGLGVVVFEPNLVGGECPFVACMPSKAMLHDAAIGTSWTRAVDRRRAVAEDLDDAAHAAEITGHGATLIRSAATLTGPDSIEADGMQFTVDHVVIATGSTASIPPIDGIDELGTRRWTSTDAMTATERPTRLIVIGGGVIGCELSTVFAKFGTEVHVLDTADTAFPELPGEIGELVDDGLRAAGVRVHRGVTIEGVACRGGGVRARLANGACVDADRVLVAAGTHPHTAGLGLETLGLDPTEPLPIGNDGRLDVDGSIWAIGDVAGKGEYTHLANHQARVVAGAIAGNGTRRFDDVVQSGCVFTDPPVITIGAAPSDFADADVVSVSARLSEIPRSITDELTDGYLAIVVDRRSRRLVAAHGVGAGFDTLAAALITAVDARIPVDQLARSVFAFPTIGELLGVLYSRALDALDGS